MKFVYIHFEFYYSFDLCHPLIDRSILCEAVNMLMNGHELTIKNEPCKMISSLNASFSCEMEDGINLLLKNLYTDNKVFLENERGNVYKVFELPKEITLLTNPNYYKFDYVSKWAQSEKKIGKEIIDVTDRYK